MHFIHNGFSHKQPSCPFPVEWAGRWWYNHALTYNSAMRMREQQPYAPTWVNWHMHHDEPEKMGTKKSSRCVRFKNRQNSFRAFEVRTVVSLGPQKRLVCFPSECRLPE